MALFSRRSNADPPAAEEQPPPARDQAGSSHDDAHIPFFGARGKARELEAEVEQLRGLLRDLGALDIVELERRREILHAEVSSEEARWQKERADEVEAREKEREKATRDLEKTLEGLRHEQSETEAKLVSLRAEIVTTEETALLQEAGIYEYRHPLDDSVEYRSQLERIKDQVRVMTKKDGGAVSGSTSWEVNGSAAKGRVMVRETSKLMLRAYNAEADTLIRGLKPYKLASALDRLNRVRETIARLGKTMDISIGDAYHQLRLVELELTADYLEKLAEEKERERDERARLREERKAQQELEREKARLEKERQHYQNVLESLREQGDEDAIARLLEQLQDVERRIADVDYRAANIRAGYVYVISNLGSFGEKMVKVGLTRRLEPLDRVRELGDASVPFRFDVHALFFSNDAVGIEHQLHVRLADRRVNRVNTRREFFYATPQEVKEHLAELAGDLLQFEDTPEALEFRQSQTEATNAAARAVATPAPPA